MLFVHGASPTTILLPRGIIKTVRASEPVWQWLSRGFAMEAAVSSSLLSLTSSKVGGRVTHNPKTKPTIHFPLRKSCSLLIKNARRGKTRIAAINDVPSVLDPAPAEITWQIVVGAIAGVTPFVVAGIEFSKRIIAQRRCEVCGGSGLVLIEKDYFRCPGCGGFLPWQSWKRFFSG